jgi:hypothetical protein
MKRGQLEISFGMIFSIIIIIAVIATSFYVIQYFTNLTKCSTIGLFYEGIQKETNTAWQGTTSKSLFVGNVPSQISYVCFGNMSLSPRSQDVERYNELKKTYRLSNSNSFMYPTQKGCSSLGDHNINHANIPEFFCIKQIGGKVKVSLEKGAFDNSVKFSAT